MCTGLCKLNTRTMQHGARFSLTLPALADIMSVAHSFPAYIAFVVIATIGPGSASSQLNSTTDVTMATRTVNLATLNYAELTTSFRPRDELKISYEEATIPDELSDSVNVDTVGITENGVMSKEQSCAKLYERFLLALSVFFPTLFVLGTLGNTLCFTTLRGKTFGSSPTNFILSTMLVVDQAIHRYCKRYARTILENKGK